ncbi:membrane-associated protein, putative [Bodo saltans]|uniref:Membrane-associated protein, putative n=1 Tax=Bodo saltans TaxID=75058 RepID=A0A0S4KK10_BODSA|nr:membrane-associated protein, putative [Bodo saltans]|eukprot:CUI15341.1 membrane-associated protein, putative [Bodo saltans]
MKKHQVVAIVVCVVALAVFGFYSFNEAPSRDVLQISPEEDRHRRRAGDATVALHLEADERPSSSAPRVHAPIASAAPQACFHNKVMFQPAVCSKVPDIVSKSLELHDGAASGGRNWSVVHVGSREGWLKLGELGDVFGNKEGGTAAIARQLKQVRAPNIDVCGPCCECVSSGELRSHPLPYTATLIDAPFQPNLVLAPSAHPYWHSHRLISAPLNDLSSCPAVLLSTLVQELSYLPTAIDVLALDAWKCDVPVVELVILGRAQLRPRLLDFTTAADVSYEPLIEKLARLGYHCYYMTTKPEHKKFRGIRQPQYPIAVKLNGCWRGVFDSFRHDRYHITCVLASDATISSVLAAFTRMSHKGLHHGCNIPSRNARMQRLDGFLSEAV